MRRHPNNVGDASNKGLLNADHLSDETLLEFLDDELSQKDAVQAKSHLYSCWICRARKDELNRGIAAIVEHQNAIADPYLPPPPEDRRIFLARLNELSSELGSPSLFPFQRSIKRLYQFATSRRRSSLAWSAASLLLVVSVILVFQLREPRIVSAKEFLDRASAAVVNGLTNQPQSVVIQRVRVQVNGKTLRSTIYRDVAHKRVASRQSASDAENAEVNAVLLETSFGWNGLLDPEAYSRWRASQPREADAVKQIGNDWLRLETSSPVGQVAEASLTVRANDFHAVAESMRLRNNTQIQVSEESWDVVGSASIPPGIFAPAARESSTETSEALPPIPARSEVPTDTDLANAEVEAQTTLHELGADLGEQIALTIRPDRVIAIDGVIADDSRKRQLAEAFRAMPYVKLNLLTVEEAAAQEEQKEQKSGVSQIARTDQRPVQLAASAPPLLESQLLTRFPDKDQRSQYVNQTLSLAQSASGRAWALNRLADQYPPDKITLLNNIERDKLHMLLTDHISALREDTSALLNQLGQILSLASNTPAVNASISDPSDHTIDRSHGSDGWQEHIRRIHSSVDVVHGSISTLLAGSPDSDKESVDSIELNLRTALNRLQVELQISDQQIRKTVVVPRETDR